MFYGVVYRITNLETNKCYIGRTKNSVRDRWYGHCHRSSNCSYLKHAIVKYGKESFSITAIASSWDSESLKDLEMLMIEQENTLAPHGYNLINNGNGAGEISEITRKKLSASSKGRVLTPETRQRMSEGRKGMVFTDEHRANLSAKKKGRPSPMKGKQFSDEARRNMGGQNKGTKLTPETKVKRSIGLKGLRWYTDGNTDCRVRDGEPVPNNFYPGRTKGLNNLQSLIDSWRDPDYRRHQAEIHKKKAARLGNTLTKI